MLPTPAPSVARSSALPHDANEDAAAVNEDAATPNRALAAAMAYFDALDPAMRLLVRTHLSSANNADDAAPPIGEVDVAEDHIAHEDYLDESTDADFDATGRECCYTLYEARQRGEDNQ